MKSTWLGPGLSAVRISVLAIVLLTGVSWSQEPTEQILPPAKKTRPQPVAQEQTPLDGLIPVTTKSGLTYYDIKVGRGDAATPTSRVSINYVVWLTDGTTFDSNAKLAKPATIRMDRPEIIEGWKEGIGSMREGGIRRLEVPWQLAYGESGKPPVGPKQDLVFEVELVKVHEAGELLPSEAIHIEKFDPAKVPPPQSVEGLSPKKTESGLTLWELKAGTVGMAKPASRVSVEYSCWLKDGTAVESTLMARRPEALDLREATAGLREAILSLRVGGRCRAEIPAALAYGSKGKSPRIPADADLLCEVGLISIEVEDLVQAELEAASGSKPRLRSAPPGIPETKSASGLKTWDLVVGDGPSPTPESEVKIHYKGWLTDGTLFDSSDNQGGPVTFPLKSALKGWTEGISSMKVGGKRRLEVPPSLGYGSAERGSPVPPNSTLVFEIELLEVK